MRQRRWLKLIKDYDFGINYHPGKINAVADALSRKSYAEVAMLLTEQRELIKEFKRMNLEFTWHDAGAEIANLILEPTLIQKIKETQKQDLHYRKSFKGYLKENIKISNYKRMDP